MPSTINGILLLCAIFATSSISVKSNEGFDIVSIYIAFVFLVIAFSKFFGSLASTKFVLIPNFGRMAANCEYVTERGKRSTFVCRPL